MVYGIQSFHVCAEPTMHWELFGSMQKKVKDMIPGFEMLVVWQERWGKCLVTLGLCYGGWERAAQVGMELRAEKEREKIQEGEMTF